MNTPVNASDSIPYYGEPASRLYHAPFPGNPHKGGVINVSTDVPKLPIAYRQQHSAKK